MSSLPPNVNSNAPRQTVAQNDGAARRSGTSGPYGPLDLVSLGSVIAENGVFYLIGPDGKRIPADLGTMMMMINFKRVENLDSQIAFQLSEIQERNAMISKLTQFMNECRRLKSDTKGTNNEITIDGVKKTADQWAQELGVSWTQQHNSENNDAWKAKWDANINNIKGKVDILNNDSQMSNIKLQNVLEKRNNAFEMTTKIMQTNNQSVQSILRNL